MRLANGPVSLPITLRVTDARRVRDTWRSQGRRPACPAPSPRGVHPLEGRGGGSSPTGRPPQASGVAQLYAKAISWSAGTFACAAHGPGVPPELALDPADTRRAFASGAGVRWWLSDAQSRAPGARVHPEAALETVDGCYCITARPNKDDDVPAAVRVTSYRVLLDRYYPRGSRLLAVFPAAMRYAGHARAVFHALVRKNYGCTISSWVAITRGSGNYYGTYERSASSSASRGRARHHPSASSTRSTASVRRHGVTENLPARRRGPRASPVPKSASCCAAASRRRPSSAGGSRQVLADGLREVAVA